MEGYAGIRDVMGLLEKIKQDYVDSAKDFWQQQRNPTTEEVKSISESPHPHVRYFRKLNVSPSFGVFYVKQPGADIGKHLSAEVAEASS